MKNFCSGEEAVVVEPVDDDRFPIGTVVTVHRCHSAFGEGNTIVEVSRDRHANVVESGLRERVLERPRILAA